MGADWQGFLRSLNEDAQRNMLDPQAAWLEFRQRARQSVSSELLLDLIAATDALPDRQRLDVALSIAGLLAPTEWSPAADQARHKVADAIRALLHAMDPQHAATLVYQLRYEFDNGVLHSLIRGLKSVLELLNGPLRPDQIGSVASLCNTLVQASQEKLKAALERAESRQELADARILFLHAFSQYTNAIREFNGKLGVAYFLDLSPPLS